MSERTTHPQAGRILALVLCAEILDMLDGTIVNVAAPTIAKDLHSSESSLQWITGGYALTFAIFLIAGARLGDLYGRRKLFVIGSWGFVLFSTLCAVAPDTSLLIASRLLQGAAAALLIPQGLGILRAAYSAEDQNKAFAVFGPVIGLSAVLGPILGGLLVDANLFGTGWRLVFLINLPVGLLAAIGAMHTFPESRVEPAPALDITGNLLFAGFAGLLTYPLIQGREAGWPAWTYAMIAASIVVLGVLVAWTRGRIRSHREPLVTPSIFAHSGFSAGIAMIVAFFGTMIGVMLSLTLFLQLGRGFSAIHAGLTLAPFALGTAIGGGVGAGVLVNRIGRVTLQIGAVVQAAGVVGILLVLHHFGVTVSSADLIAPLLVWGIGLGLVVAPLFGFVLASVSDEEAGSASGVINAMQQLSGSIGVAVLGTIFFSVLANQGFVPGLERTLQIALCAAPVLLGLSFLLPKQARDEGETPVPANEVVLSPVGSSA